MRRPIGAAEVDLDHRGLRSRGQTGRLLRLGDVTSKRDLRRRLGHRPEFVAHHQLAPNEVEAAHHRIGGVEHLGETDARTTPHRRQRLGEPGPGDQVIRRGGATPLADQSGHVDEEPCHTIAARMIEHVAIPPRAVDARCVAGAGSETPMRPRHPCHRGLHLGQTAEGCRIGRHVRHRRCVDVERRHVPRTAHHGDPIVARPAGGADRPAHVGFTLEFSLRGDESLAGRGHRLGNGIEGRCAVTSVFDHVLPPPFRIGVTSCRGEFTQWIGRRGLCHQGGVVISAHGEGDRQWEVDGVDLDVVVVGPADRLPFGAERGERGERCPSRLGGHVGQQRDRGHQARFTHPPQRGIDVGGGLDQHDVGP